jgi:hypothetical protein
MDLMRLLPTLHPKCFFVEIYKTALEPELHPPFPRIATKLDDLTGQTRKRQLTKGRKMQRKSGEPSGNQTVNRPKSSSITSSRPMCFEGTASHRTEEYAVPLKHDNGDRVIETLAKCS